eukprot:4915445-Heterocapsa_arctica.AAC.1
MFLKAPASLGAVASSFVEHLAWDGPVDYSLQSVEVSSMLDCLLPNIGSGLCDGHLLDEFR